MKKILSLILSITILLTLCFALLSFNVYAEENATAVFNKSSVTVGDTVTLTLTVSAPEMSGINVTGTYNDVLTLVSGAEGGAGNFQIVNSDSFNGENKKSFTVTFKAAKAGTCTVSIAGQVASGIPPVDADISATASVTVNDVTKSDNAKLSSLKVGVGTLTPAFSSEVTAYTVNVEYSVTKCAVYAVAADKDATFVVNGSESLSVGSNTRVVVVTAPSGAQKSYTITIVRAEKSQEQIAKEKEEELKKQQELQKEQEQEVSSTPEVPSALEVVIDGASYLILDDISGVELPVGFNIIEYSYNGEEISVATDEKGNYQLFYLKCADGEEVVPYTYNEVEKAFEKVQIITQGSNSYIVAKIPEELRVPDDYTEATVEIQNMTINAYMSSDSDLKEMYYIYCYYSGNYNMYRYDTLENIIQRSPEFKLVSTELTVDNSNVGLIGRFNMLTNNAKTIVVCLCVLFVGVVALIVLSVIKLIKRGKYDDFDLDSDEDEFDSITFDDYEE